MCKSIKSKVVIYVAALIIAIVTLQAIGNILLAKPYLKYTKADQMQRMFHDLDVFINDHHDFEDAMLHYREVENIHVTIREKDEVVFSTETVIEAFDKNSFSITPEIQIKINDHTGSESLYLNGLIKTDHEVYYVSLYTPISAIDRSVLLVNKMNITIAGVAVLIGGVLAFLWGRKLTKPIIEINEVAQNVAVLNFDKRLDEEGQDEISVLKQSINSMSDQLFTLIQELQSANEKLSRDVDHQKRIDEMRKSFIANVSHELKSPLALMVMYCENLKNGIEGIDKTFYYDVIVDESKRLSNLVNKLLEISSLENGLVKMSSELMDISNMVIWLCSKKSVLYDRHHVSLHFDVADGLFIHGDVFYLEQAISNLLDNASRYTSNGQVQLTLYESDEDVVISVYNQGENVVDEDLDKLWDAFYREDEAHTANEEGHAGLGLYITKTIVTAHQGIYGAINEADGMTFYIKFKKGDQFEIQL